MSVPSKPKIRRKSVKTAPLSVTVRGEDSIINFIPQIPMRAELHTRNYTPNPNRFSFMIGELQFIIYLDSGKGFVLGKDENVVGHLNKSNVKNGFYQFSTAVKALKNGRLKNK
jgi:hypothetical protein